MGKSKDVKAKSKGSKGSDSLTSVKGGAITKSLNGGVTKAKQIAETAVKAVTKGKGKKEKPKPADDLTDESASESESESESDASASDSDDSVDEKVSKPKAATNGKTKAGNAAKASVSDDESDSSESEAEVKPKAATNGKGTKATNGKGVKATNGAKAAADSSDSSESSGSDDDSEDGDSEESDDENVKAAATKHVTQSKVNGKSKKDDVKSSDAEDGSDSGSDGSDADSGSDDSDSDDSDASEKVDADSKKADTKGSQKRKAEAVESAVDEPWKKARTESSGKSNTLFAGNLSWAVDDNVLYDEFKQFGNLLSARVVTDRETGRSRGFGYVDFASAEDAEKALEAKQGAFVEGRDLRLDFSNRDNKKNNSFGGNDESPAVRAKKFGDVLSPESETLFVGNLSWQADEDAVSAFFNEVAVVSSLRIPTDQESGRPKGFAYVTFNSVEEAKSALEALNGQSCAGRAVRLDYSTPRPQREFGGGGGRDFGGGGFGGRGGRGGRGRGGGDFRGGRGGGGRGGRGGRGGFNNNRGGGGFQGKKISFD